MQELAEETQMLRNAPSPPKRSTQRLENTARNLPPKPGSASPPRHISTSPPRQRGRVHGHLDPGNSGGVVLDHRSIRAMSPHPGKMGAFGLQERVMEGGNARSVSPSSLYAQQVASRGVSPQQQRMRSEAARLHGAHGANSHPAHYLEEIVDLHNKAPSIYIAKPDSGSQAVAIFNNSFNSRATGHSRDISPARSGASTPSRRSSRMSARGGSPGPQPRSRRESIGNGVHVHPRDLSPSPSSRSQYSNGNGDGAAASQMSSAYNIYPSDRPYTSPEKPQRGPEASQAYLAGKGESGGSRPTTPGRPGGKIPGTHHRGESSSRYPGGGQTNGHWDPGIEQQQAPAARVPATYLMASFRDVFEQMAPRETQETSPAPAGKKSGPPPSHQIPGATAHETGRPGYGARSVVPARREGGQDPPDEHLKNWSAHLDQFWTPEKNAAPRPKSPGGILRNTNSNTNSSPNSARRAHIPLPLSNEAAQELPFLSKVLPKSLSKSPRNENSGANAPPPNDPGRRNGASSHPSAYQHEGITSPESQRRRPDGRAYVNGFVPISNRSVPPPREPHQTDFFTKLCQCCGEVEMTRMEIV
jgi:hypothetical protein